MIKRVFVIGFFVSMTALCLFLPKSSFIRNKSIQTITQHSLQKEALSTLYLSELLGLSHDKPVERNAFDLEEATKKLLSSPIIEDGKIEFIDDTHLRVEYKHLSPIALLGDFKNLAIDSKGRLFPVEPFFPPSSIVKVYLGIDQLQGEESIDQYKEKTRWQFAKDVISALPRLEIGGDVISIDVSKIEEKSLGKNELILEVEYLKRKDVLRLSKRNYLKEIENYTILCDKLKNDEGTLMIDFRFDDCAFIERF